jgi:hypothetical protein
MCQERENDTENGVTGDQENRRHRRNQKKPAPTAYAVRLRIERVMMGADKEIA